MVMTVAIVTIKVLIVIVAVVVIVVVFITIDGGYLTQRAVISVSRSPSQ